jgi:putative acetyltransferase
VTAAIRAARAPDAAAIDALLRAAFAGAAEACLVVALRAEGAVVTELVAEAGGAIVGHVLFSPAPVDGVPVVALAPLAVAAGARRQGVGAALVQEGLARCAAAGAQAALVLGDPAYYGRFGFRPAEGMSGATWCSHPAFQALALAAGAAPPRGVVRYACAFGATGQDAPEREGDRRCP